MFGGGGGYFGPPLVNHVLVTNVWLRRYPTREVLGFLFGGSDSTARRAVNRCLPVLEKAGRARCGCPILVGAGAKNTQVLLKRVVAQLSEFALAQSLRVNGGCGGGQGHGLRA